MDRKSNLRTDMAVELIDEKLDFPLDNERIKRTDIKIDEILSKKYNKPKGRYSTIETDIITCGDKFLYTKVSNALGEVISEMLGNVKSCLMVGLGNPDMTADALGNMVGENILVTRHLQTEFGSKVIALSSLCPNVLGVTGIESYDIIKGVVERIKPDCVIVVDSLASAATYRIGKAFQVCSSGITPGSGVSNSRVRLDKKSLGVEVLSIGVPLVVYASTIIEDVLSNISGDVIDKVRENYGDIASLVVTPKDIDLLVSDCATVVAAAINYAVHKIDSIN